MARLPDPEMEEIQIDLEGIDEEKYNSIGLAFFNIIKGAIVKSESREKKNEDRREV